MLASGAPFCPDPLEPYLLPSQLHYLKTSSALDDPLNNFVVCDRPKPNTEINQEILKQHKEELRKKNFQTLRKSKAALNIFICQRGITTKKFTLISMFPTLAVDLIMGLPTKAGKMCSGKFEPA